jgi:putative DNA primase/helicase
MIPNSEHECKTSSAAALDYAARGWRVLPLHHITDDGVCSCKAGAKCGRSSGKHPRIRKWTEPGAASTDSATIRAWWRKWSLANVGILTGPESGIFDLEVEEEGLADLAALAEANGTLPRTPLAASGTAACTTSSAGPRAGWW